MKKANLVFILLFLSVNIFSQDSLIGTFDNPALSAVQIITVNPFAPDSIYWLDPDGNGGEDPFQAYCDMTTDGGGWTLVLLSNASVSQCPSPTWDEVVNAINYNGVLSNDITSFDLFLGVKYWNSLGTEIRLDMGANPDSLSHRAIYDFSLNELNNYALTMSNEAVLIHTEGTGSPGMYTYHNGRPLSTCNADHDAAGGNCANYYNCAAWWYGNCWSGSYWGGGGESYIDAPYWSGTSSENYAYGSIWLRGTWTPALPTVTTQPVTDSSFTTATGNGNITDLGSPNPTAHGVCWNTTGAPEITNSCTDEGGTSSTGEFTSLMTGLSPNTTYYVRAYVSNFAGISYGGEVNFTTPKDSIPPDIECTDTTVYLDASGTALIDTTYINVKVTDNCGVDTLYLSKYIYGCDDLGADTVWLYAEDSSGNIGSCQAVVTVYDTILPIISCPDDQFVDADSSNTYTISGNDLVPVLAEDNCTYSLVNDLNYSDTLAGTILPAGITTIKWIITDVSGNSDSCSFSIDVDDYVGIITVAGKKVSVYPNPFKDRVFVELLKEENSLKIEVTNITGSIIYNEEVADKKTEIDFNGYPAGIYYIYIKMNDQETVTKLIKQ
jgi:hypothetical protein